MARGRHGRRKVRWGIVVLVVALLACVAACVAIAVLRPSFAEPLLERLPAPVSQFLQRETGAEASAASEAADASGAAEAAADASGADGAEGASSEAAPQASTFSELADAEPTEAELAQAEEERKRTQPTPLVARYGDVDIHCCITPEELTGVLFHQASYNYALVMETELPEADYEKALNSRSTRINHEQDSGKWLDADALHVWRTSDTTPMDTSIDIGAKAGTTACAPVTGTVVLVVDYKLYDEIPDIRIQIQPEGHPELDCVLLHTTDPLVEPGDHVEGGVTPICSVRDIEKDLTDVQLGFYTPDGVGGNHVHVQLNDASDATYRKERLKGAYKVKE